MRASIVAVAWILLVAGVAAAAPTPTTSSPPAAAATPTPATVTQASGALPASLAGTWLVVSSTQSQNGLVINWHIYRIAHDDAGWRLQQYDRPRASPFDALMQEARKLQKAPLPAPETLKAMKETLPTLQLLPEHETFRAVLLRTPDQVPSSPPPPPEARDAKFSIEILDKTNGNTVAAVQYFVKDGHEDQMIGETHAVTLVAAGLGVLPIEAGGQFKMYRLQ
jgi:hypothetical protein